MWKFDKIKILTDTRIFFFIRKLLEASHQGGRTWQAFGGGKNGHETFRQARIYNCHDKCVVLARNLKFSNLTQQNMQYIPCNSALCAQETLF